MDSGAVRILLVEDDPDVREAVAGLLGECGYAVELAGTVQAALAALREGSFGLVVLDLALEGESGTAVLCEATERGAPVLVATALGARERSRALAGLAPAGLLQKPFDAETLLAAVRSLLLDPDTP